MAPRNPKFRNSAARAARSNQSRMEMWKPIIRTQPDTELGTSPAREPALNRRIAFAAASAGQESFNANVLVEVGPFDGVPVAEQTPVLSLGFGAVKQTWIPRPRHAQAPAVGQFDDEGIGRDL